MSDDIQLARIVTLGIIVVTLAALVAGTLLRLQGITDSALTTVVAGGVGALAGFLARGRSSDDTSPSA